MHDRTYAGHGRCYTVQMQDECMTGNMQYRTDAGHDFVMLSVLSCCRAVPRVGPTQSVLALLGYVRPPPHVWIASGPHGCVSAFSPTDL